MAYHSSGYSYNTDSGAGQRDELADIQLRMNSTTDSSLESTRRMLALTEESTDAGVKTIVALNEQGEQLERIEEGMDKINTDMKDAERNLEGLEKCCGLCVLPWKKQKPPQGDYNSTWKQQDSGSSNTDGPRHTVGSKSQPSGPMIQRITDDAREDEMEDNLQQVGSMIGNLKNMAIDMGNEIETQNRTVTRINEKSEVNEARVKDANRRANKILNS